MPKIEKRDGTRERREERRENREEIREERRDKREERRQNRERVLNLSWLRVRRPSPFLSPKSPYQPQAGLIGIYIYIHKYSHISIYIYIYICDRRRETDIHKGDNNFS